MNGSAVYLDTSAFLKLVVREAESPALQRFLEPWQRWVSAALIRTEVVRALRRAGCDGLVPQARRLLGTLHLVRLDEQLLDRAADLEPAHLRSLDAVHLAAAIALGSDLGTFVSYDDRLRDSAVLAGLRADAPR